MSAPDKVISVEPNEKALVISVLCKRLDEMSVKSLESEVTEAAAAAPGKPIVMDLSKLDFAPSVALGALARLVGDFKFFGRRCILAGVTQRVRGTMNVTRLDTLIEIRPSVADALAQLGTPKK